MRQRLGVLRRVLANPRLRRVELAFLGFGIAEYGVWVSVLVYAYERGGTTTAAAIAVLQLLPAAVVAPMAARLADTRGGAEALRIGYVAQALSLASSATLLLLHAPSATVYAGAVVAASAVTLTRPAQGTLLPSIVDSPAQLTAANVVSGWVESISLLAGPALAGIMIALQGPGAALALFTVAVAIAAVLIGPISDKPELRERGRDTGPVTVTDVLRAEPGVPRVLTIVSMQFLALGALDILEVVLAIKVLSLGASGAGYLGAAFGAGGAIGAVVALGLVGRHRLVGALLAAAWGWGAAFAVLGLWPTVPGAFVLLAGCGVSRTVLDVCGRTMLHRVVPPAFHGRVFGVLEGLAMLGLALGSLLVPALVGLGGAELALLGVGGALVIVPLAMMRALRTLEQRAPALELELALIRQNALFAMLAPPLLEDLARALVRQTFTAGSVIVREGDWGGHFYVLAEGSLEVSKAGRKLRTIPPGGGFGEIALLRDGLRTATVTAIEDSTIYALDRAPFLEAVTGSYNVHRAAQEHVTRLLGDG